jgi:hypothetical protein
MQTQGMQAVATPPGAAPAPHLRGLTAFSHPRRAARPRARRLKAPESWVLGPAHAAFGRVEECHLQPPTTPRIAPAQMSHMALSTLFRVCLTAFVNVRALQLYSMHQPVLVQFLSPVCVCNSGQQIHSIYQKRHEHCLFQWMPPYFFMLLRQQMQESLLCSCTRVAMHTYISFQRNNAIYPAYPDTTFDADGSVCAKWRLRSKQPNSRSISVSGGSSGNKANSPSTALATPSSAPGPPAPQASVAIGSGS